MQIRRISLKGNSSGSRMPRSGLRMAQITPASTPAVTCRLVALLQGHSARAWWIDKREPYQ